MLKSDKPYETFEEVVHRMLLVHHAFKRGASPKDMVVLLANALEDAKANALLANTGAKQLFVVPEQFAADLTAAKPVTDLRGTVWKNKAPSDLVPVSSVQDTPDSDADSNCHVMHVPSISTAHITQQDGEHLEELDDSEVFCHNDDGSTVLIRIYHEATKETIERDFFRYSDAFKQVLLCLHDMGYRYVRFDPDGSIIPGWETFDW